MRILKYREIFENVNDTPENYVHSVLLKIKYKIEKIFKNKDELDSSGNIKRYTDNDDNIVDMGIQLQSLELSKYSKVEDSLKLIFSDDDHRYDLYIGINLKNAIPKEDQEFSEEDIKKCFIKFKKYTDGSYIGEISRNIEIKDIDQKLLLDLKMELDNKYGDEDDEFEIVTD